MGLIHFDGKPCPTCGGTLRFSKRQNVCVACAKKRVVEWRATNPEKVALQRQRQKMSKIERRKAADPYFDSTPTHEQLVEMGKKYRGEV